MYSLALMITCALGLFAHNFEALIGARMRCASHLEGWFFGFVHRFPTTEGVLEFDIV